METSLRTGLVAVVALLLLGGCRSAPVPTYTQWSSSSAADSNPAAGPNAFEDYTRAATAAERAAGPWLNRVSFTPGQQVEAIRSAQGPIVAVEQGVGKPCKFRFQPSKPFEVKPHQRGWRLIGRVLAWEIQQAGAVDKPGGYDRAVRLALLATNFGFDLTHGCATDAALGLRIADDARVAIAPFMQKMGAAQLGRLGDGMKAALDRKPTLIEAIGHEHENMLQGVQTVQDAYQANNYDVLKKNLTSDVREAIDYLQQLRGNDEKKRPAYFEGFAGEADEVSRYTQRIALLPTIKRGAEKGPRLSPERPWRRFAKHFFGGCDALLAMNDATLARSRLLVLECGVIQQIKVTHQAPPDLRGFEAQYRLDPFTGQPFVYHADGVTYKLYSRGENFRDDGGETGATHSSPDLDLEIPSH